MNKEIAVNPSDKEGKVKSINTVEGIYKVDVLSKDKKEIHKNTTKAQLR